MSAMFLLKNISSKCQNALEERKIKLGERCCKGRNKIEIILLYK